MNFCLEKSVVGTLSQWFLNLIILKSLCKNKPPNIMIIGEEKKRWVQDPSGGFFTFYKINMYGLECFRYVCDELLSRILLHCYHMVELLLVLESWSITLVLDRQWILEEIWGLIQLYVFLYTWNLLVVLCPLFLSLSWRIYFQCRWTNKNVTTMWGIVL